MQQCVFAHEPSASNTRPTTDPPKNIGNNAIMGFEWIKGEVNFVGIMINMEAGGSSVHR